MLHTRDTSVGPGQLTVMEKQTKTIVRGVYQNLDKLGNFLPQSQPGTANFLPDRFAFPEQRSGVVLHLGKQHVHAWQYRCLQREHSCLKLSQGMANAAHRATLSCSVL